MSPTAATHPNLLFIMTDQERYTQYFPDGWEERNLPNMHKLKQDGLSFTNAYICTSMCTPSRTAMFTGKYPSQTGVTKTLGVGDRYDPNKYNPTDIELDPAIPNLATMLHRAGYARIHYLGKWHMSKGFNGVQELLPRQIAAYGFAGWVPPDGGQDWRVTNIAGGYFDKDNAYTQEAVKFIQDRHQEGASGSPWCLVLSLINPHDIWTYPGAFDQTGYSNDMLQGEFTDKKIPLPPTINEELDRNGKPSSQFQIKLAQDKKVGPLDTDDKQRAYLNFYGNLMKMADAQIGVVLKQLEDSEFKNSTVVVRTADHGEMGLSHGGLRQKMFNMYEETLRVPLVISTPALIGKGTTTDQLASTIDLIPTIAGLLGVPPLKDIHGKDLSPLVKDPKYPKDIRTEILFTFDDFRIEGKQPSAVQAADRIRCVRQGQWKYARYFHADSSYDEEYEMYDLINDPRETDNLAWPDSKRYSDPVVVINRANLMTLLAQLERTELPK